MQRRADAGLPLVMTETGVEPRHGLQKYFSSTTNNNNTSWKLPSLQIYIFKDPNNCCERTSDRCKPHSQTHTHTYKRKITKTNKQEHHYYCYYTATHTSLADTQPSSTTAEQTLCSLLWDPVSALARKLRPCSRDRRSVLSTLLIPPHGMDDDRPRFLPSCSPLSSLFLCHVWFLYVVVVPALFSFA